LKLHRKIFALTLLLALFLAMTDTDASDAASSAPPRYLALTFDDGPSGAITERLLDGLRERGVPVTFFLCGYRVTQYPSLVARIAADGHELGVHGLSHQYMQKMSEDQTKCELEGTAFAIAEIVGETPCLFRPPGGLTGPRMLAEARREGFSLILWSIDPEDWKNHDAAKVTRMICRSAKDGGVILMHDMSSTSVAAALRAIDTLTAQGWRFVTVSEMAALRRTTLRPGEIYKSFPD